MNRLIPRTLVRIKNERLVDARFMLDRRLWTLALSERGRHAVTYLTYAGLANRLRAHYAAAILAAKLGRDVAPIWIPTKELASNGDDVLVRAESAVGSTLVALHRVALANLPSGIERLQRSRRLVVLDYEAQWSPFTATQQRLMHRDPVALPLVDSVLAQARAIRGDLEPAVLAVHVRRGDFLTHTPYAKDEGYFLAQIDEACARQPFATLVVATDGAFRVPPAVARRFTRVIELTPRFARTQHGVAGEAMSHVLVLAAADQFIPSPHSSFSELVIALRDGTLRVSS